MIRPNRKLTIEVAGQPVRLEAFFPPGVERSPALLLVHGASGMDGGHRYVPHCAGALAAEGFTTVLIRYFDATRTSYADDAEIRRHSDRWLLTLDEATTAVAQFPEADPGRLAIMGYSLGAYLAVVHAAGDRRIRALVEFAGGIEAEFAKSVTHLPPTLLVHGESDRRVPFSRAGELEAVLQRIGAPYETRYFPGEKHVLSPPATFVALSEAVDFLHRHLA